MNRLQHSPFSVLGVALLAVFVLAGDVAFGAPFVRLHPAKDGTLLDGGIAGPFDGIADDADWYFNDEPSSFEGSITLSTASSQIEHRLVWEYSLATVNFTPPVTAHLTFFLRGAPAFPRPDVDVHIYAYPSDLQETLADFSAEPIAFQDHVIVAPYQPTTAFRIDVSQEIDRALSQGLGAVAFRFQVHPGTLHGVSQAFLDAAESDVETKPVLTLIDSLPADADGSGRVDLGDHAWFVFCMNGPGVPAAADESCDPLLINFNDSSDDDDLDLRDFAAFQRVFGWQR